MSRRNWVPELVDPLYLGDVKRLRGYEPPEWRLRVGPLRVRFAYQGQESTILVLRVLPRGRAYD